MRVAEVAELAGKTLASNVHDPLDKQVSDSDVTLTSFVAAAKTWEADSVELWA